MPNERPLGRSTVIADHAERIAKNPTAFVATLLRSRSRHALEILAHLASDGAAQTEELVAAAESGELRALTPSGDPALLGQVARVLALQGPSPDAASAVALYTAIWEEYGPASIHTRDVAVYLQLLQQQRRRPALIQRLENAALPEAVHASLLADLVNPTIYPDEEGGAQLWLERLSVALGFATTLALRNGDDSPFDRLTMNPQTHERHPRMITVITSAYNPDTSLINAARSLIAQSWQNWEMLVIDDASTGSEAHRILREVERMDPRIRIIRKAVNGGTYRARNTALLQARGEFVTCLDSDDWAHPERLLRGVKPLLENPAVVATRSQGARVSSMLELTRPGYGPLFPAASSLMFRLQPAVGRIGFFDSVRKAADTEYARRLESAFGAAVVDVGGGAMTVLRADDASLSAAEFSSGWRHPARWAYKQSYGLRHRAIRSAKADPFVEPDRAPRSFGVQRWSKPHDNVPAVRGPLDVVIAGDWRRYGGPQISMLEEIRALRHDGRRVGVLHIEAMRFFTQRDDPLCEPLRELLADGHVTLVHLDDPVDVGLLLLRYPPILQFPPAEPAKLRVKKLRIVANQAPAERNGADQRYVPIDVHDHAQELFGVTPFWVPQSPRIRKVLEPLLPDGALAPWDNPAIIDAQEWDIERGRMTSGRFTVGRFSRDDVIKFPASGSEFLAAYSFPRPTQVLMMGARTQVKRLLADAGVSEIPDNWTVLPHKAMPVKEFLARLDVVVYMDHPDAYEAFGRSLLESAASGLLVVASPKHRINFGDALVYAEPDEVVDVVERYLSDRRLLDDQLERSRQAVLSQWSQEAFLRRLQEDLPARTPVVAAANGDPVGAGAVVIQRAPGASLRLLQYGLTGADVFSVEVRRFADGESCSHLIVIHNAADRGVAVEFSRKVVESYRPGWPIELPAVLPAGVVGLVWSDRDYGNWSVSLEGPWETEVANTRTLKISRRGTGIGE